MKKHWWKGAAFLLVLYSIFGGLTFDVPRVFILNETIRNIHFHVPMWFTMMALMGASVIFSIRWLSSANPLDDIRAKEAAHAGLAFCFLGLITGSVWARFTWGAWWVNDPKLNGAAITALVYLAYFVLRSSVDESQQKARLASVYNIFAFVMLIVFLWVWPRMKNVDSLHPGNGGNPAFSVYEDNMDMRLRKVFYPAVLGWILLGFWILNLRVRLAKLRNRELLNDIDHENT